MTATARGIARPAGDRAMAARPGAEATAGWRQIAERSVVDNVFFDPAFALAAAEGLGARIEPATVAAEGGGLDALVPLVRRRFGRVAPVATGFAHEYGPLGMPLAASRDGAGRVLDAVFAVAGPKSGVVLPYLVAEDRLTLAIVDAAKAAGRSVELIDSHERAMFDRSEGVDPMALLVQRRRKEYGRQLRRLDETGTVSFIEATSPAEVAAAFEAFLALEAAGWKGKKGSSLAAHAETASFSRRAVLGLAEAGRAKILSLTVDGRPAAIVVCLIAGATAFTWKIAYDESLARFSPGAQLMLKAPPLLFADPAIQRIDSCAAPNHPMIDHLWRGRLKLTTVVISPERGRLRYRAGLFLHAAERKARDVARRLRDRRPSTNQRGES